MTIMTMTTDQQFRPNSCAHICTAVTALVFMADRRPELVDSSSGLGELGKRYRTIPTTTTTTHASLKPKQLLSMPVGSTGSEQIC